MNQQEPPKPIVLYEGSGGHCLIVLNPYAGLRETTTYRLQESGRQVIRHVGANLGVYRLDQKAGD